MIYLLDTDHVSFLQAATTAGHNILQRLRAIRPDDYGTTVITYEEQCRGWLDKINRAQSATSRVAASADLQDNLDFFSRTAVWSYDERAEAEFGRLTQAKVRLGTKDLRIACIALVNGATVLTRNSRDFSRVPGLLYDDWSA